MATANDILKIARAELGYKESPAGSNRTKYGRAYGYDGVAWCAMFVWWVFKQANASALFFGGKKCAYCPTIADYYIAKKQTVSKSSGRAGDIILFGFGHTNSQHIGIIEKKNADGSYTCIEGNTAVDNSCNGGMVMRRTRYRSDINWIVRPKYDGTSTKPEPTNPYILEVDGDWGRLTNITTQHIFGKKETGKLGSASWKAIQLEIGMKGQQLGGKETKTTIKYMQEYLNKTIKAGLIVDGVRGKLTNKAWQKWCNTRVK